VIARYTAGETGARAAARRGADVVVIDAFRASTTVAVLISKGALVMPVGSLEEALAVEADYRVGERGSAKVEGFDLGNSPTEVMEADIFPGDTVALSTTNGTRVVGAASGARRIFTGAFANASALAEHLIGKEEVMLVGCGWEGRRASEDESAAGAILHRLQKMGAELDGRAQRVVGLYFRRSPDALYKNSAARRLKRLGNHADLEFCLSEDTVPVVPVLQEGVFVGSSS
jgi:2-phosphosulfolactate phosphatase